MEISANIRPGAARAFGDEGDALAGARAAGFADRATDFPANAQASRGDDLPPRRERAAHTRHCDLDEPQAGWPTPCLSGSRGDV